MDKNREGYRMAQVISDRDCLVHMAKISEQAERYDEMVVFMVSVAKQKQDLADDELVLLSTAYKHAIGSRRSSWRVINAIETHGGYEHIDATQAYKAVIEEELYKYISEFVDILRIFLIPNANSDETEVFYYKMKGDFQRYLAEFQSDPEVREASINGCKDAYQTASQIAHMNLTPTHPIRLSLALNFSVFYYEILNSSDRACHVAKEAFDDAINELDTLAEETYKDSTLIIQLLRDNLSLWASGSKGGMEDHHEPEAF